MTAEEFLNDIRFITYSQEEKLIAFAQYHVEQALKAAAETDIIGFSPALDFERDDVDKESILNAYPPENIK